MLAALTQKGMLRRDLDTRRYRLTLRLLELGTRLLDQLELPQAARPHLRELSGRTGETAHVGVLDGWHVVFVGKHEPPSPIRLHARVGFRAPSHCTGIGKVLLAGLPPDALAEYLLDYSFTPLTERTLSDAGAFSAHLELVRARGYAIDAEEHRPGIGCVAAPVRDHAGQVIAGISVSGPAFRVLEDGSSPLVESVTEAGGALSRDLGWTAPNPDSMAAAGGVRAARVE